jgi:hypothetical protein
MLNDIVPVHGVSERTRHKNRLKRAAASKVKPRVRKEVLHYFSVDTVQSILPVGVGGVGGPPTTEGTPVPSSRSRRTKW